MLQYVTSLVPDDCWKAIMWYLVSYKVTCNHIFDDKTVIDFRLHFAPGLQSAICILYWSKGIAFICIEFHAHVFAGLWSKIVVQRINLPKNNLINHISCASSITYVYLSIFIAVGILSFLQNEHVCIMWTCTLKTYFLDVHSKYILFSSVAVKFRFVVFRPFVDEILTGRIRSSNHEGVQGLQCFQMKLFLSKHELKS